ncbi:glycosyltransferase family 4 protein [Sneathiella glossodoripedis]|uniref:glycosyltransferase family 4 protein n=1 Tax=Sneathiella glossodoripedis TaxID=418853 RepID=UPI000471DC86
MLYQPESKSVITVVLKGYPRLSETFIAQELRALEKLGHRLHLISLRHPTDKKRHPIHSEIEAPVTYLPEYLYQEPLRVLKSWWKVRKLPTYRQVFSQWLKDLKRDFSSNRVRRFGQALVLAAELPKNSSHIYAHFLHTPASVARYAAKFCDLPWSCSAHAKDIYTSQEWEIGEKLDDLKWLVTCTSFNVSHLRKLATAPDKIELLYHGLDLSRFPKVNGKRHISDGRSADAKVRILSVGRMVAKKGYDDLINALALLPDNLHWEFEHIGGGSILSELQKQAEKLGIAGQINWRGAQSQQTVLQAMQEADIFVLASRIAEDGDRDGLPNVLMEAQSQKAAILSTRVSAIPELIEHEKTGLLVEQRDPEGMAQALATLITTPTLREKLTEAGDSFLRDNFDANKWIGKLSSKFAKESQR